MRRQNFLKKNVSGYKKGERNMTEQALNEAIRRLITKRMTADEEEQERLNTKLTKLYEIKYLMIQQRVHQG